MSFDAASLQTAERLLNSAAADCAAGGLLFKIHYWGANPQHYSNPVHRHSFYEVCLALHGEGEYLDADTVYPVAPGTLFLSRPGIWHQIRSSEGLQLLFVAFEAVEEESDREAMEAYVRSLRQTNRIVVQNAFDLPAALYWKGLIQQTAVPHSAWNESMAEQACGLLLFSFVTAFGEGENVSFGAEEGYRKVPASKWVYLAKRYIRDNLSEPLKLRQVAGYFNLSERHLSRMFSKYSDQSFSEYLRSERIRAAESLLKTTHLSIQEIAEQAGFSSVHYFTNVFTVSKGDPPGVYRKSALKACDEGSDR